MNIEYVIARHRIRVTGERLINGIAALPGFEPFKATDEGETVGEWVDCDAVPPTLAEVQHSNEIDGIVSCFGRYDEGFCFEMKPADADALTLWMKDDTHTVYLTGNYCPRLLRFACWIAYGLLTTALKTIAIHTSTIQYRGKAVLFLGESGTGKSTHTRLWRENIDGAVLLNDDSPIIRIIDGKPWAFGSPWSGKTPCYKNESYPLAGCVRLSQAPYNQIKKLSIAQAYGALHPSCPPCFAYDDKLYDSISEALSDLLSAVPVYHLACLPNAEAARLSCETLFGVCEN